VYKGGPFGGQHILQRVPSPEKEQSNGEPEHEERFGLGRICVVERADRRDGRRAACIFHRAPGFRSWEKSSVHCDRRLQRRRGTGYGGGQLRWQRISTRCLNACGERRSDRFGGTAVSCLAPPPLLLPGSV